MDNLPNYYQLLHVQPDAPTAVIKASYRAMMQKMRLHPDLGGDESLAQRLNEAVATLCKNDKREEYDLWLDSTNQSETPARQNSTSEPSHAAAGGTPSGSTQSNSSTNQKKASARKKGNEDQVRLPKHQQCPFCFAPYPSSGTAISGYQMNNRCAQCKGARSPIESVSLGSDEEIRKIYRHTHQSQVWLHTEWPAKNALSATMTDISIAGCALQCADALPLQSVIMLDTPMLNSLCLVRYQKKLGPSDDYAIGLEFLTLDIIAGPGSVFSATA